MSKIYQRKKELLRQEIRKIIERDGHCTPESLVKAASKKTSPIHAFFTWNEKQAAAKWRLEEAAFYLRKIHVVLETKRGAVKTREFVHVAIQPGRPESEAKSGIYAPIETVINDPRSMGFVLSQARAELESFKVKYSIYAELAGVIGHIEKAIRNLDAKGA